MAVVTDGSLGSPSRHMMSPEAWIEHSFKTPYIERVHLCEDIKVVTIECRDYGHEPELEELNIFHKLLLTSTQADCECSPVKLPDFIMAPESVGQFYDPSKLGYDIILRWSKCIPLGWDNSKACYVYIKTATEGSTLFIDDTALKESMKYATHSSPTYTVSSTGYYTTGTTAAVTIPSYSIDTVSLITTIAVAGTDL